MNVVLHLSIIAVLILVIAVVSIANVPARETNLDAASDGPKLTMRQRLSITMSAWREPRTYALGVILLGMAFAEGGANDWLPPRIVHRHGGDKELRAPPAPRLLA